MKQYKTKSIGVDEKGIVRIAVNAFGNKDADGDISEKGSFKKTLLENFGRVKWFLNHDPSILLGVPLSGEETDEHLVMTAQFNMNKQIAVDTYNDYKLYSEHGRTLEHSIGVKAIKRDQSNKALVKEWQLWEFSTLTGWGANYNTPLLDLKGLKDCPENQIELLKKALGLNYSEERLSKIENTLSLIEKSTKNEVVMVECPCCGALFNYNDYEEYSLERQAIDSAINRAQWITEGIVAERMQALEPMIRTEVDFILSKSLDLTNIESFSYIRCPKCWERVTKRSAMEPSIDTQSDKSRVDTLDLKGIAEYIKVN